MRNILFLGLLSPALWCQTPPRFTLTDLGVLPSFGACIATSISQNGKNIAGYCHFPGGQVGNGEAGGGFYYANGAMTALPLPGGNQVVTGVNDSGTVIGFDIPSGADIASDLTGGRTTAFTYQIGSSQLSNIPLSYFWPAAVNSSGSIAGFQLNPNSSTLLSGYVLYGSQITALSGSGNAVALAISPQGIIGGGVLSINPFNLTVTSQPVVWTNNNRSFLSNQPGFTNAFVLGVNDSGAAAGVAFNPGQATSDSQTINVTFTDLHAIAWNGSNPTDLAPKMGTKFSVASGVNKNGWMVGYRTDTIAFSGFGLLDLALYADEPAFRAFLYTSGTVYDLNTLVDQATGWTLTNATAVNDAGQIVGAGFIGGAEHAFLLTPEPVQPPPPGPSISGFKGGGFSVPPVTSITANGYFTIGGANFAPAGTVGTLGGSDIVNSLLPTKLASTCVNAGSARAFLSYVTPTQINAVAPALPASGNVAVSVVSNCGTANEETSPAINVPVAAASPEFLYWVQNANGQDPVVAVDAVSGAYIGPPGLISGVTFRPARGGDILTIYGISFGRTGGGPVPGMIPAAADSAPSGYSVTIGTQTAAASYVGVTPGSGGLYQVNLTVPTGLAPGNYSIVLTVNGVSSPAGAFLAVGP